MSYLIEKSVTRADRTTQQTYFKSSDNTGEEYTSSISDAHRFPSEGAAQMTMNELMACGYFRVIQTGSRSE